MLLREKAYEEIKKRILDRTYEAGEILSENALVQALGMSRTPIRGALSLLSSEGFVEVVPQKGAIVIGMTVEEARDIFDLRIALESYVAEQIAGRLRPEEIQQLEEMLAQQQSAVEQKDRMTLIGLDFAFHLFLVEKHGNKRMTGIMSNLRDRMIQCSSRALGDEVKLIRTVEEHKAVLRSLIDPTGNSPGQTMRSHLENGRSRFLEG